MIGGQRAARHRNAVDEFPRKTVRRTHVEPPAAVLETDLQKTAVFKHDTFADLNRILTFRQHFSAIADGVLMSVNDRLGQKAGKR